MHKASLIIWIGIVAACLSLTQNAHALSRSQYASSSKLASGKWVKIKVPKNGVYEITTQELAEMGFSNPANVRVYGAGGHLMNEVLNGSATDDLVPVPASHTSDKVIFYAKGPVEFSLANPTSAKPYYSRTINTYANEGCYFLTESGGNDDITKSSATAIGTEAHASSLNYYYHEQEMRSLGFSGRHLLGERITSAEKKFAVSLPGIVEGSKICFSPVVAAKIERNSSGYSSGYVQIIYHTDATADTLKLTTTESAIACLNSTLEYYNTAKPVCAITPKKYSENGYLEFNFTIPSNLDFKDAYIDYIMATYERSNSMRLARDGQMQLGFAQINSNYRVEVPNASADLMVWNISDEAHPVEQNITDHISDNGESIKSFSPGISASWAQFVAFSPSQTLLKIAGYETVENQDLHSLETPDMVIVTNSTLHEQAERLADLHRRNDGFTVHVIDQDKIFNEFSSGTPDAMAIRLMNKMFYDRNRTKFKYLLMFGCGSYDNRQIATKKDNTVITYESENSNNENYSYVSDDFFGVLADNSGSNICLDLLSIGVGRIPSTSSSEAKNDIDKIATYINDPDYGAWRNNVFITCDEDDTGKETHIFQAVGIDNLINDDLNNNFFTDKAYVDIFPNATPESEPFVFESQLTAIQARRHMTEALKAGQYFWTYVGHAGSCFTKYRHMWTTTQVREVNYEHQPIFTGACCDVARYDSDTRSIVERMFHKKDGGAIAIFSATRSVYSDKNDVLNRAWVNAMFSAGADGEMPRLGDIYLATKQAFKNSSVAVTDKVKYLLMGDPAIKVNYPRPLFKVTEINGTAIAEGTTVQTRPMQKLTVTAHVMRSDGKTIDSNFSGTAFVSLYDVENKFKDITKTVSGNATTRTVYYPRTLLAQVEGRVVNGVLQASIVVPRDIEAQNSKGMITVYAHKDGTDNMVNGKFNDITLMFYNEGDHLTDNAAPVIEKMYFNDESQFTEGACISSSATLYVKATDDLALSNKSVGLNSAITLTLDGGKTTFNEAKNAAVISNDGKEANIALPMSGLEMGNHQITFSICDAAGNRSSRTIPFFVGPSGEVSLQVEETPATQKATFCIDSNLTETSEMTVKVTDAAGKHIWSTKTSTFPVVWDLKDNNGQKVKPGLYRYWGTYQTSSEYGGTNIGRLIVADEF